MNVKYVTTLTKQLFVNPASRRYCVVPYIVDWAVVRSRGSDGQNSGCQHLLWDHRIFMAYIKSIFLLIWTLTLVKIT